MHKQNTELKAQVKGRGLGALGGGRPPRRTASGAGRDEPIPYTREEIVKMMRNRMCFRCGQTGHMRTECTNGAKDMRAELKALN